MRVKEIIENREQIRNVLIPLLFQDGHAREFNCVKKYFKENNLSINLIQKNFDQLKNPRDPNFWKYITKILSEIYKKDVFSEEFLKLIEINFQKFIEKLIKIRFEFEFEIVEKEERLIENEKSWDKIFQERESFIIEDEKSYYLFYPLYNTRKEYTQPFEAKLISTYPFVLMKVDKNKKKVEIGGSKNYVKTAISYIQKTYEKPLQPKRVSEFLNFTINPKVFLLKLREENIFIRRIKLNDPHFKIDVASKKTLLNLEDFIDYSLLFYDVSDFLKIEELHLIYSKKVDNRNFEDIKFKLTIDKSRQEKDDTIERFFTVRLTVVGQVKKNLKENDIESELKEKLKKLGLEIDKSFSIPFSHFFNRFIILERHRKRYFKILNEIEKNNDILTILQKNKIISEKGELHEEKFINFLKKHLIKTKNIPYLTENERFDILEIKKEESMIVLRVKCSSEKKERKDAVYHEIVIPIRETRPNLYKKLTKIILININFYFIIERLVHENINEVVKYFYSLHRHYLLFYSPLLEKEAGNAYIFLKDILSENNLARLSRENKNIWKTLGKTIEKNINIILKCLFGNFLFYGGKNQPDGILALGEKEEEIFIIDSKQHKKIRKNELRKMIEYIKKSGEEQFSLKTNNGVFIISRELFKFAENKSLNYKAKKELMNRESIAIAIGFITVEFIIQLFEIYRYNINLFKENEISAKLKDCFKNAFEYSNDTSNIQEIIKNEEKIIDDLISFLRTKREFYLPQKVREEI